MGADSLWSQLALKYTNTETIHFSFVGHTKYCNNAVGMRINISQSMLNIADKSLSIAKSGNHRNFPCKSTSVNNLLRRNYYQIIDSDSCYAVSKIEYGIVQGGTSWATQMFIDNHMKNNPFDECKCWVYDMNTNKWHQWVYDKWQVCDDCSVLIPNGIWTGIGSRELTPKAIEAMEQLMKRVA